MCKSSGHSKIEFQFKRSKSYHYVSHVKSETSDIWRTGTWFLKSSEETVEGDHIYHLIKPNFTVKTRTGYRGCNVCSKFFRKLEKLTLKANCKTLT